MDWTGGAGKRRGVVVENSRSPAQAAPPPILGMHDADVYASLRVAILLQENIGDKREYCMCVWVGVPCLELPL